jgi:hypothetical protein
MSKWRAPFSTAVAMATGILLLISLFVPQLDILRSSILGWAILLAAVALLLGLANLFQVHLHKIRSKEKSVYSFVLIAGMIVSFLITVLQGRQGVLADWLFNAVQVPLESSLMALLAISLTLVAAKLIQERKDIGSLIFVATLVLILLGSAPIFGFDLPLFSAVITPFITRVLSLGGLRALLIGVGLGTLATGIRILMGSDRPFSG